MRIFLSSFAITIIIFSTIILMGITDSVCKENLTGEKTSAFSVVVNENKVTINIDFMGIEKILEI